MLIFLTFFPLDQRMLRLVIMHAMIFRDQVVLEIMGGCRIDCQARKEEITSFKVHSLCHPRCSDVVKCSSCVGREEWRAVLATFLERQARWYLSMNGWLDVEV